MRPLATLALEIEAILAIFKGLKAETLFAILVGFFRTALSELKPVLFEASFARFAILNISAVSFAIAFIFEKSIAKAA